MSDTDRPDGGEIYNFKKENPHLSWFDLGKHYGEDSEAVRGRARRYQLKHKLPALGKQGRNDIVDKPPNWETESLGTHKVRFTDKGFRAELYSESDRIKSLDQLLNACNADLSKWRVARHIVNVWEGGRKKKVVDLKWNHGVMDGFVEDTGEWQLTDFWQIKAIFEPREEEPWEKALDGQIDRVREHAPTYDVSSFSYNPTKDGYLLVPNLYDTHLGKRSHRSRNTTLERAKEDFMRISDSIASMAQASPKKPARILFPVGQDLLHVDTIKDTTSRGTWVEASGDVRLAIDAACEATAFAVERFAAVSPVEVIPVEGNHDRLMTYWLGKYLQAFFAKHPHVKVHDMDLERQYYQWGRVGLGLTHDGKKPQELATLFPIEARHMWPEIEWTEWLTGHFHHQRGALYAVDSVRGTVVRTISALCDLDNYHSLHLYAGTRRAAEVLYYHNENGPAGSVPVFVSELN